MGVAAGRGRRGLGFRTGRDCRARTSKPTGAGPPNPHLGREPRNESRLAQSQRRRYLDRARRRLPQRPKARVLHLHVQPVKQLKGAIMFAAMNRVTMTRPVAAAISRRGGRLLAAVVLLLLSLSSTGAAEKKILVPGDPPLTQDMVDDYAKYLEWRLGPAIARAGDSARLAEMIIAD